MDVHAGERPVTEALVFGTFQATRTAAARALGWLAEAAGAGRLDSDRLAIDGLAIARVCSLINDDLTDVAQALVPRILKGRTALNWAASDLFATLLALSGVIRGEDAIGDDAANYLALLRDVNAERQGRQDALLNQALDGTAGAFDSSQPVALEQALPLRFDRLDALKGVLYLIEQGSAFGARAWPNDSLHFARLLEGAAVATLRGYELPFGMRLLRAVRYLDKGHSAGLATGFEFLRLSQGEDGGFGDYDAVIARMAAQTPSQDADLPLRLPVTLQALWTMAELERPAFHLLGRAFGSTGLLREGGRPGC